MEGERRRYLRQLGQVGGSLVSITLAGCTVLGSQNQQPTTVRIGSKPFPEQEILGYLAYEHLQDLPGIQVVDEIGYGDSAENWSATASGVKHLYWEYTGTAWARLPPQRDERITSPEKLTPRVREDARTQGIRMAEPAPYSNEWVLVADKEWSAQTGVTTISDFAEYVATGTTDFGVAFGEDFYHRPDAWPGLADFYDVDQDTRTRLESGTFIVTSAGLTDDLVTAGEAQVASGFATDPSLQQDSLVTLDDDRNYFLPYQPAPTAHAPTADAHPEIFTALSPVASSLDEARIRQLNRRVAIHEQSPQSVAQTHLQTIDTEP